MYKPKPAAQHNLVSQLKDERSKLQDLCWELDDLERLLADIDSGHAQTPLNQTKQIKQRRDSIEEAVLRQMMYIDRLEKKLKYGDFSAVSAA